MRNLTSTTDNLNDCITRTWCRGHLASEAEPFHHQSEKVYVAATADREGMRLCPDREIAEFSTVLMWLEEVEEPQLDGLLLGIEIRSPWGSTATYLSAEDCRLLAANFNGLLNAADWELSDGDGA